MSLRLTEESLARLQEKRKQWEKEGKIITHRIEPSKFADNGRAAAQSRSKYRNVKTEADGMTFSSSKEARRWMDLRLLEHADVIQKLKRQVRFKLDVNGVHICDFIADFTYQQNGFVVEDSKGYKTREFRLKALLMLAVHSIKVLET